MVRMSEDVISIDNILIIIMILILGAWNWIVASHLETPYPHLLIEIYAVPIARVLLILIVIVGSIWSPTVGLLSALAYVSLGADVIFFTQQKQVEKELLEENKKAM